MTDPAPEGRPPTVVLGERYRPRVCAALDCALPPYVRWLVAGDGYLYGMDRRVGDAIDLCDSHEPEVVDMCGAGWDDDIPTPPRQRLAEPDARVSGLSGAAD